MKRRRDLGNQLAMAMSVLTIVTLVGASVTFYIVYGLLVHYGVLKDVGPDTSVYDGLTLLGISIAAIWLSLFIAFRFAHRIGGPLQSVRDAARKVATGDLTARAAVQHHASSETAQLVADFNDMAARLEHMAQGMVVWNAQIAHELRTPLTILRGRLQGVRDGVFDMNEGLVGALLLQVDGLTRLVEDLRSVSLADSGRLRMELEEVDLAAEIEDLSLLLHPMLKRAGFTLRLDLEAGTARVDMARIRQALLALVDNATRYADPCEVRITTRFEQDRAEIRVVDAGPGMPADFLDHAFQPFSRSGSKDHPSGSGLGLAVVRAIATAHGGMIACEQVAGSFAFVVTLPARSPAAVP